MAMMDLGKIRSQRPGRLGSRFFRLYRHRQRGLKPQPTVTKTSDLVFIPAGLGWRYRHVSRVPWAYRAEREKDRQLRAEAGRLEQQAQQLRAEARRLRWDQGALSILGK
jgi:hypothetical protein